MQLYLKIDFKKAEDQQKNTEAARSPTFCSQKNYTEFHVWRAVGGMGGE